MGDTKGGPPGQIAVTPEMIQAAWEHFSDTWADWPGSDIAAKRFFAEIYQVMATASDAKSSP
jgi:hypothetical protein